MMEALIIKTSEIYNIEDTYKTAEFIVNFDSENNLFKTDITSVFDDNHKTFYILSNGLTYEDHELIINIDNIRDFKIKKLLN